MLGLRRVADFPSFASGKRANWSETAKSRSGVASGVDETLGLPEKIEPNCAAVVIVVLDSNATFLAKMVARVSDHTIAPADAFCRSKIVSV